MGRKAMNRIVAILGLVLALAGAVVWVVFRAMARGGPANWGEILEHGTYGALSGLGLLCALIGVVVLVLGLALPNQKKMEI